MTVKRGEIIPGITKKVASVNGNAENTAYAHTADTIDWAITATNSGRQGITDYTLTDAMESPYSYTGAVEYAIRCGRWQKISSRLFRIGGGMGKKMVRLLGRASDIYRELRSRKLTG